MVTKDAPTPARPTPTRESDRLLRPHPPAPVPPRVHLAPPPKTLAYALLGARVVK